ncbi:MAG TPA: hypothetical protein VJQ78_09395 [Sphingobium sp.]|nr:hypothetical protein [Sphingobium sp.]
MQRPTLRAGPIQQGKPVALVRRHPEAGVDHAERVEDPPLHDLAQRPSFDAREQATQHIDARRIGEALARFGDQRQVAQRGKPHVRPARVQQRHAQSFGIGRAQRTGSGIGGGEPGPMREQILDRDRAGRWPDSVQGA